MQRISKYVVIILKKDPIRIVGIVFAVIGYTELAAALVLLAVRGDVTNLLAFIFGIQGLIFSSIGSVFLISDRRRRKRRDELLAGGYYEFATVISVDSDHGVRINGRHPFRVVCRIERDGILHEYRSDHCMRHPGLQPGDPIAVYLDRFDENRYYVDVESASPTIIEH